MKSMLRPPAVAGKFYPGIPPTLRGDVEKYIHDAKPGGYKPKALIAPHAGYMYSGPVAGTAYATLAGMEDLISRVVLLGPSHHVAFNGLALPDTNAFETPLGSVPLDAEAVEILKPLSAVVTLDEAHSSEHSLEVHLPFLQVMLGEFTIVPLVVGRATPEQVELILETLWGGGETLFVVSSDLSHYHDYQTARQLDLATSEAIEKNLPEQVDSNHACGCIPIKGLLLAAKKRRLKGHAMDVRNSGDTAGSRDQVVGYGAYVFTYEN